MERILRFEELVKKKLWTGFEDLYRELRKECRNDKEKWDLDTERYTLLQTFLLWRNEERIDCPACGGFHYAVECAIEYGNRGIIYRTPCGATLEVEEKEVYLCPVCFTASESFEYEFDEEAGNFRVRLGCGHVVDEDALSRNSFFRKEVRLKDKG